MLTNPKLLLRAKLLIEAGEAQHFKQFFRYVDDLSTTEKVLNHHGVLVDTLVPCELIDKFFIWARYFLPEYFRDKSPRFHRAIVALLLSRKNEYLAAPRGFSKTTLIQAVIMFIIANRLEKFCVLLEKTLEEASELVTAVREEFATNEDILSIYGDLIGTLENQLIASEDGENQKHKTNKETQTDVFINGMRLRGKGFSASPRGLRARAHRPGLIVLDDTEKDANIESEVQRDKSMSAYNKAVQPAVDTTGSCKVFGTIMHKASMLNTLIELHKGYIFRAWYIPSDENYEQLELPEQHLTDPMSTRLAGDSRIKLLWPERWPWALIERKIKDMMDKNLSTSAAIQELRNDPISEQERKFKAEWLWDPARRITLDEIKKSGKVFNGYAALDFADSTKSKSDWTGCVVHLIDRDGNRYRVDCRRERRNIKGKIDLIFELWTLWQNWGLMNIGIEKKAFDDEIRPLFEDECKRRLVYPVITELKHMGRSKEARILGALEPLYQYRKVWTVGEWRPGPNNELIFIPTGQTNELLQELYDFPRAANDDLCFVAGTMVATPFGDRPIETLRRGDYVLTPFGYRKILAAGCTGTKEVITKHNLTGTPDHPIFINGKFDDLDTEAYNGTLESLTFSRFLQWRYRRKLYLMESPTALWEARKSIIFLNQRLILEGSVLKDSMWQFGSFITKRKYRNATIFTTSTATLLITTFLIWSVYRLTNIARTISRKGLKKILNFLKKALIGHKKPQKNGMDQKKVGFGIRSMRRIIGRIQTSFVSIARNAMRFLMPTIKTQDFVVEHVICDHGVGKTRNTTKNTCENTTLRKEPVYNITVEKDHVYYANGILVSNCDAEAYIRDLATVPFHDKAHDEQQSVPIELDPWRNQGNSGDYIDDGIIYSNPVDALDPY